MWVVFRAVGVLVGSLKVDVGGACVVFVTSGATTVLVVGGGRVRRMVVGGAGVMLEVCVCCVLVLFDEQDGQANVSVYCRA